MWRSHPLTARQFGSIFIIISILLFIIFLSSTLDLVKAADIACREICGPDMGSSCPHAISIPLQSYAGFSLTFVLAAIGVFTVLSGNKYQEELTERERALEKTIESLEGDGKRACELIRGAGGAMFQSELKERMGVSKVKVTRILDKLETKRLIERRRRGITNLVIFKRRD